MCSSALFDRANSRQNYTWNSWHLYSSVQDHVTNNKFRNKNSDQNNKASLKSSLPWYSFMTKIFDQRNTTFIVHILPISDCWYIPWMDSQFPFCSQVFVDLSLPDCSVCIYAPNLFWSRFLICLNGIWFTVFCVSFQLWVLNRYDIMIKMAGWEKSSPAEGHQQRLCWAQYSSINKDYTSTNFSTSTSSITWSNISSDSGQSSSKSSSSSSMSSSSLSSSSKPIPIHIFLTVKCNTYAVVLQHSKKVRLSWPILDIPKIFY